jgi:hypothetical protein
MAHVNAEIEEHLRELKDARVRGKYSITGRRYVALEKLQEGYVALMDGSHCIVSTRHQTERVKTKLTTLRSNIKKKNIKHAQTPPTIHMG